MLLEVFNMRCHGWLPKKCVNYKHKNGDWQKEMYFPVHVGNGSLPPTHSKRRH